MNGAAEAGTERLLAMINGFRTTQVVYVIAKLSLADHLAKSSLTPGELAAQVNADPRNLGRVLRLAASFGLVVEEPEGRFRLTALGQPLRSGIEGSVRPIAIMLGELHYRAWGALLYSVQSGESAFQHVYDKPLFAYMADHPDAQVAFDAYMSANKDPFADSLADKYDFSGLRVMVDVGAGNGSVSAAILERNPNLEAVIFDQPQVLAAAKTRLNLAAVDSRCRLVPGDFFESVPKGGDLYLLSNIIHDWDDEQALRILSNCREAMTPTAAMILLEAVLPLHGQPSRAAMADVNMMVMLTGQERTEDEYRSLLAGAGLRLSHVIAVSDRLSLIEARPE